MSIAARIVVVVGLILPAVPLRADVFEDVALGLWYAGFDVIGDNNPLSGGADLLVSNSFTDDRFDFGAWDLTLTGPVSFQFSTGGRYLSQFDVSLSTAVDARSNATPLFYELNYDVGGQSTQISGSALLDAKFALNGFGFYELNVDYSYRQSVENSGNVETDDAEFDNDFGPITITGNLFTDALALITEPFFERTGRENPFASLSVAARLIDADPAQQLSILKALAGSGGDPELPAAAFGLPGALRNAGLGPNVGNAARPGAAGRTSDVVVPEPAVILLLLLGLPALLGRTCFRRRHADRPV